MNKIIRNTPEPDDALIIQGDLPESLCHLQHVAVAFALLHKTLKDYTTNTGSASLVTEHITMNATSAQGARNAIERAYKIADIGKHTITITPHNAQSSFTIKLVVRPTEAGVTADFYVVDSTGTDTHIENSAEASVQADTKKLQMI